MHQSTMQGLKVIHTVRNYQPDGGIYTYLSTLVAEQRKQGLDAYVLCEGRRSGEVGALSEHVPPDTDLVHAHDLWQPRGNMPAVRIQSLHNYDFGCSSRERRLGAATPCSRAHGAGCVIHWSTCAHTPRLDKLVSQYSATTRALERVRAATLVVAYSQFVATSALSNGIASDRLHVLQIPFERRHIDPSYDFAEPNEILFTGRLSKTKGVDTLIEAVGMLRDARLSVVGDGYQRMDLARLASRVARGRVVFRGWVPKNEIDEYYRRASVVAMPGRWPEPLGLVGLEAAWAGRPVVASMTGGVPDWLHHLQTGIGVRGGDARALAQSLEYAIVNRERARAMGAAARAHVETWPDVERHVRDLTRLYEGAVGGAPASAV